MNTNLSDTVITLLENYQKDTQTIEVLRRAISSAPRASALDIIDSMNFSHGDGTGSMPHHISDRTAFIAMHYQERMKKVNDDATGKIAKRLWDMEQERERLNFYVSLLETRQEMAIRLYYMKGKSREEVSEALDVAVRTFHKIRKSAIQRLIEMYELTSELNQ